MTEQVCSDAIALAKSALRAQARAARDALDAPVRKRASAAIAAKLLALPQWRAARSVLGYSSIGSEVDTALLLNQALAAGKVLVLPRINKALRRLELARVAHIDNDTRSGVWGIREPLEACPTVNVDSIDLVIVPGLAFDATGARIGYGGGYYDDLLGRVTPHCWRVALCFAAQIVQHVPCAARDERVQLVLTESSEWRAHLHA